MSIFAAENLRDWVGKHVIDPSGAKIGEMEAVYVDTTSDAPSIDADGELLAESEPQVFSHYGMATGNGQGRRLARR